MLLFCIQQETGRFHERTALTQYSLYINSTAKHCMSSYTSPYMRLFLISLPSHVLVFYTKSLRFLFIQLYVFHFSCSFLPQPPAAQYRHKSSTHIFFLSFFRSLFHFHTSLCLLAQLKWLAHTVNTVMVRTGLTFDCHKGRLRCWQAMSLPTTVTIFFFGRQGGGGGATCTGKGWAMSKLL